MALKYQQMRFLKKYIEKIMDQAKISLSILFLSSVDAETLLAEWKKVKGL